jgi:two-component system sensor histidine kinase HydH
MPATVTTPPAERLKRIEELGRIILAYSEVTEKLQKSHDQLKRNVAELRAELREKNQQLERKNRLAALGEMAAGMAHEIRNPLGGIQLYASLLANDLHDCVPSLELVQKITGGVKRLEMVVSHVLQFTREIRIESKPADLASIVQNAVELARPKIQERGILLQVQHESLAVQLDEHLFGQALLNLVLNAIEAMPPTGTLSISYRSADPQDAARQFHLSVRDTGPGIAPNVLERIFNPFFTTKDNGTGLGLAIVHRVVDAHNGVITAGNLPDGGAQFEIRI